MSTTTCLCVILLSEVATYIFYVFFIRGISSTSLKLFLRHCTFLRETDRLHLLFINCTFQSSHRDLRAARPRCNTLSIYPSFGSVVCSHVSSVNRHRKCRYYGVTISICAACTSRGRMKIWGTLKSIFLGLHNVLSTKYLCF